MRIYPIIGYSYGRQRLVMLVVQSSLREKTTMIRRFNGGGLDMRFSIGRLVITTNANNILDEKSWVHALARHVNGDWGDVCEEDEGMNDEALVCAARIFSVYKDSSGRKFWIITEADRSYTTILLPDDY